jgi:hypothetical protein
LTYLVNVLLVYSKQKNMGVNLLFVGILKITEEKRRIRYSVVGIRGSGVMLKRPGSGTLVPLALVEFFSFSPHWIVQDERNRRWVWEEEEAER